jgi:hypothetical protein
MDRGRGKSLNFAAGKHMICNTCGYSKNRVIQKNLVIQEPCYSNTNASNEWLDFWDVFIV